MMDRVRKALFDSLGLDLSQAKVLDLFCGTGALGIEAYSRGAKEVIFVDKSPQALNLVRENLKRIGLKAELYRLDIPRGLQKLKDKAPFHLVFVTPPYGQGLAQKTLPALLSLELLAPEAWIIVEERKDSFSPEVKGLKLQKRKIYGQTELFFFQQENS